MDDGGLTTPYAHLSVNLAAFHAVRLGIDQQGAQTVVSFESRQAYKRKQPPAGKTVGDPHFLAVEAKSAVHQDRGGFGRGGIATRVRLGQCESAEVLGIAPFGQQVAAERLPGVLH